MWNKIAGRHRPVWRFRLWKREGLFFSRLEEYTNDLVKCSQESSLYSLYCYSRYTLIWWPFLVLPRVVAVCLDCVLSYCPYNQSLQSLGSRDRAGDDLHFLWKILK